MYYSKVLEKMKLIHELKNVTQQIEILKSGQWYLLIIPILLPCSMQMKPQSNHVALYLINYSQSEKVLRSNVYFRSAFRPKLQSQ